jgi:hypothetical protein
MQPAQAAREKEGADGWGPQVSDREGRRRGVEGTTPSGKRIRVNAPWACGPTGPGEGGDCLRRETGLVWWPGSARLDSRKGFRIGFKFRISMDFRIW